MKNLTIISCLTFILTTFCMIGSESRQSLRKRSLQTREAEKAQLLTKPQVDAIRKDFFTTNQTTIDAFMAANPDELIRTIRYICPCNHDKVQAYLTLIIKNAELRLTKIYSHEEIQSLIDRSSALPDINQLTLHQTREF